MLSAYCDRIKKEKENRKEKRLPRSVAIRCSTFIFAKILFSGS